MAINWSAYEAAKELYGDNKENIQDIGSRYPLFARTVSMLNSDYLLDILKAIPKVTARVVETGLKDGVEQEEAEAKDEAPKSEKTKSQQKREKVQKSEADETEGYDSMTAKELYKMCCERGISSKCKSRSKDALIKVLEAYDNGALDSEEEKPKKNTKAEKAKAKKVEPVEDEEDDWDDTEDEEETDPYAGKTAKELYKLCGDRGIKTKPKQSADVYAKLLKKADAEAEEPEDDEDDSDWEI